MTQSMTPTLTLADLIKKEIDIPYPSEGEPVDLADLFDDDKYVSAECPSRYEDYILFVQTDNDEGVPNPLEDWGETGSIFSFSHRHGNYYKPLAWMNDLDEAVESIRDEYGDDWVPLGYFEHGRCDWHLSGNRPLGTEGDYRWDGTSFAGFWVPEESMLTYYEGLEGAERQAKLREHAAQACEIYTQWCNGDVYGYTVAIYRRKGNYDKLNDYRYDAAEAEDSCWGFYGWKDVEEAAREAVEMVLKDFVKTLED